MDDLRLLLEFPDLLLLSDRLGIIIPSVPRMFMLSSGHWIVDLSSHVITIKDWRVNIICSNSRPQEYLTVLLYYNHGLNWYDVRLCDALAIGAKGILACIVLYHLVTYDTHDPLFHYRGIYILLWKRVLKFCPQDRVLGLSSWR